ncbi:hypothetical protein RGQ29_024545 [Quercus rubra]|uniref:Uncharacterized protein n=1 Tax=Quercus rubra TaxID=3512 RepID=A0AAN7EVB4_QUERU|nr:hypothetical protein RGQ29_024545 [Quercus rubra]
MEGRNLRHEHGGQQELGSSTRVHTAFGFLILSLLSLLQVKYQNFGNPYQTHGATMLLFILAVLVYTIALAGISQLTSNTSYLPLLRCVCFIFGAFACDLLLLILVPPFGWFILILCVCMSVRLLCDSHRQILECFQQIYQLINQSTSKAFNILCSCKRVVVFQISIPIMVASS